MTFLPPFVVEMIDMARVASMLDNDPNATVRLTQSDDFDDTRVHVMDDDVIAIDQPSEDGEPNVVVLDRDMVVELVGVLNTWLSATR